MDEVENKNFNFIKLEGERFRDGNVTISDIRDVIDGLEKTAKYFISTDYPSISKNDYEIEVRLEAGSLVAWLIGIAFTGGVGVATAFGVAYAKKAGETLATNDIGEKTTADILAPAVQKMKSTARIAKHVGGMAKQRFDTARIIDKDTIYIPNERGEELRVSQQELDTYVRAPKDIYKKLTNVLDDKTQLYIGEAGETTKSDTIVELDGSSKQYFGSTDAVDDGILFPEWQHGETLTLTGELRRANTNTGTLGFFYEGHTITSSLYQMEIRDIKDSLFDKEVEIVATVTRTQKKLDAEDDLKKPKLEIKKITTIGDIKKKQLQTAELFSVEAVSDIIE